MPARTFRLITTWSIPAPAPRVWEVLADPGFTWPAWWPGLHAERVGMIAGPDGLGGAGSWVRLRVRSPVGGTLDLRLDLVEAHAPGPLRSGPEHPGPEHPGPGRPAQKRPGRAKLRVSGDLRGGGSVAVSERPDGPTEVRLTWVVIPTKGRPALVARAAPALCVWAHARVMRAGERGLTRHLARALAPS
ncbi:hypothetical protein [Myceligenerans pegani]|uniref:Polyketide cyclase / dehydrase and lipid transport n=1 Tax=Myceligenerans pegani TaxID=2776917 RepID=A0ABR9N231_9MICO|nr:hypothetical protein [Myceligenerans sp. TRM 65318]MBE1877709.1 hypothetical protein [Myceligenerans sp. TRM 65318]MBE3019980.1 hypothetical protein [Myceligenerans sp. TRM 65318]